MSNSNRRGFFGQICAGIVAFAGYTFFPFFKKEPNKLGFYTEFPKLNKNDDIFLKPVDSWGNPVAFWNFDGKGNIIHIVNNKGISLNSKSFSITYRS